MNLKLKDNSRYKTYNDEKGLKVCWVNIKDEKIKDFSDDVDAGTLSLLENISNETIENLLDDKGNNLLIYPQSFKQCDDQMYKSSIFTLQRKNSTYGELKELSFQTGNLAGFIGIGKLRISIGSRFSNSAEDYFLHYMLSKVLSFNIMNLDYSAKKDDVFNLLHFFFPRMLNEAMSQGPFKQYCTRRYNDANVKGCIDVNRHIRYNVPANGKVAYNCREFSYDNPMMQLIRHTIEYMRTKPTARGVLTVDAETRANVMAIVQATPSYIRNQRRRVMHANMRPLHHPYFTKYIALQKLCLQILRDEKMRYAESGEAVHGVLIDVAWLWEEYLATLLRDKGFIHPENKNGSSPIYLAEGKKLRRFPDFYKQAIVMDAKYKTGDITKGWGTRDDIHQMIAYMYRLQASKGIFIRPRFGEVKENINNELELLQGENGGQATLSDYFFAVPQVDDFLGFCKAMEYQENALQKFSCNC